jgi:hypothetical protein
MFITHICPAGQRSPAPTGAHGAPVGGEGEKHPASTAINVSAGRIGCGR